MSSFCDYSTRHHILSSYPGPALATRKITEPEARALLSDYATLMKHGFVCDADSDDPFRWNVGSVSITAGMRIEYVVKFQDSAGSLPMGEVEMKSLLMDSQIEIETETE